MQALRHIVRRMLVVPAALAALAAPVGALAAPLGNLVQLAGTNACVSETGSSGNCVDGLALDGADAAAVTKNGLYIYVVSANSNAVTTFQRLPSTGALAQLAGTAACVSETGTGGACSDGKSLAEPRGIAISNDSKNVYVASTTSDGVAVFARNVQSGVLTQLAGTAGCVTETGTAGSCADGVALLGARGVALSPNGSNLYVAARDSDSVAVFARDRKTGALTQLAGTAGCISDSGTAGACVNGVGLDFATSVAVSPNGKNVYATAAGSNAVTVFARDIRTGALTQLAGTAGCISEDGTGGLCTDGQALLGAFAVVVSAEGKNVYVASRDSNAVAVFARDRRTGALTQLAGTAGCVSEDGTGGLCADGNALIGASGVAIAQNGKNVYVTAENSNAVTAFARDAKTGALTQLAGTNGCVSEDGTGFSCADGVAITEPRAVVVTRNGRSVYVTSSTSDAVAAFARQ
jgi:6-phosphogluconolactonase (cycloisomerase 2 family)